LFFVTALCAFAAVLYVSVLNVGLAEASVLSERENNFIRLCKDASYDPTPDRLKEIQAAIDAGVNVNARNGEALFEAVSMTVHYRKHGTVVSILLKAGADVNARYRREGIEGITVLMVAAGEGNLEVASALLKAGADANAKNNDGVTALMGAAINGHPEVASALLNAGADVNAKNNDGVTALMLAASRRRHPEVASALLNAGADVNAKAKGGETALMVAARSGNTEVASALLKAGADANVRDNLGKTALDYADNYAPSIWAKSPVFDELMKATKK
jgi:ankyrin repeat protein